MTQRDAWKGCAVGVSSLNPDQLVPAVERMVTALDPPEPDAVLVALARRQARVIDSMGNAEAVSMLPNHTGQLLKVLTELEDRSRRRRAASRGGRPNEVRRMRAAHMTAAKGKAG